MTSLYKLTSPMKTYLNSYFLKTTHFNNFTKRWHHIGTKSQEPVFELKHE